MLSNDGSCHAPDDRHALRGLHTCILLVLDGTSVLDAGVASSRHGGIAAVLQTCKDLGQSPGMQNSSSSKDNQVEKQSLLLRVNRKFTHP